MFIVRRERLFLLTASHVAVETLATSTLILNDANGKAVRVPIEWLTQGRSWKHHPVADLASVRVSMTRDNESLLQGRFFPIDHVATDSTPVSRDTELTAIGFPLGLGGDGMFSPLTFRTFAASSIVTFPRADTKTLCNFFVLESPSVGGYSGGPVFDLGYIVSAAMTQTKERTVCHGFIHGTLCDDTGGKLAAVTPASYLDGWL